MFTQFSLQPHCAIFYVKAKSVDLLIETNKTVIKMQGITCSFLDLATLLLQQSNKMRLMFSV